MAYYNVCPKCGATLDPGEPCDCEKLREEQQELFLRRIKETPGTGQYSFQWGGKEVSYEAGNIH